MDAEMIGYRKLMARILVEAWKDAQKGDHASKEFLKSEWATELAEALDLKLYAEKVDELARFI